MSKRHSCRNIRIILTGLVALLLLASFQAASGQSGYRVFLPLVNRNEPKINTNPIHQGMATFYWEANGTGSCTFEASPNDMMVAAMNAVEYNNAIYCGAYLNVIGPAGATIVRVVDKCPGCGEGWLDLSPQAFAKLIPAGEDIGVVGRVAVTWQVVSPPINEPIVYYFVEKNPWWTAVQIRNHRNPIAKFEYLKNGQWVEVPRRDHNVFVEENGMGNGPYTFRVTDWYGNALIDTNIPLVQGTVSGAAQFPPWP